MRAVPPYTHPDNRASICDYAHACASESKTVECAWCAGVRVGDVVLPITTGPVPTSTIAATHAGGVVIELNASHIVVQTHGVVESVYTTLVTGSAYYVGIDGTPVRFDALPSGVPLFIHLVGTALAPDKLLLQLGGPVFRHQR